MAKPNKNGSPEARKYGVSFKHRSQGKKAGAFVQVMKQPKRAIPPEPVVAPLKANLWERLK